MTYNDLGFRELYHRFVAIKLDDNLKKAVEGFKGAEEADGAILYGYIDHKAGFTFEVIAAGRLGESGIIANTEANDEIKSIIRAEVIANEELINLDANEEMLATLHANKLDMLQAYDDSEEIFETREMDFLDECRDCFYVDDIKVLLVKDGLKSEVCWARIEGTTESEIQGTLLNEPYQDYGCHEGDIILINIHKTDDDHVICYSSFD